MPLTKSLRFTFICTLLSFCAAAQNFDINLLKSINQNENSFKDHFFKATAQSVNVFNVAAPAGVFVAGLIKHDKQ